MLFVFKGLVEFDYVGVIKSAHNLNFVEDGGRVSHVLLGDDFDCPHVMGKHS